MSKIKEALNEAKNSKKKMLPELHALDDKIEEFIQKLEDRINAVQDNPIFIQKAHQLLGDMSKEYSEFMFALRAIVNAVDRKGQVLPKEKPFGKVRDVNSRQGQTPPGDDEVEVGDPAEGEAPNESKLKEALEL